MIREITVNADIENIAVVTEFVNEALKTARCPGRAQMQIDIAIDELFSNIAYYAYGQRGGDILLRLEFPEVSGGVRLTFIDRGTPFNPLKKKDPDITLSAEERQIGGLGIYMVKQSMDEVSYEYTDGENRLTVVKKW